MHGLRKRDAAFLDALNLHGLRGRMVYLEDCQSVGKSGTAKREAVKSGTDQDILMYTPDCRLPQRILRVAGADHYSREGGVGQQKLVQDGIGREHGAGSRV